MRLVEHVAETVSADIRPRIREILVKHERIGESLLAILQEAQETFSYLPDTVIGETAAWLGLPVHQVYSVATFYNAFSLKPKGKYVIQVCMGTACHVRGSPAIVEEAETILGISRGETTKDGKFTLETVNCVGACALGPVMVINGDYHGHLTRSQIAGILEKYS
jgi:NADH-quinone oxidoreductase subunit E